MNPFQLEKMNEEEQAAMEAANSGAVLPQPSLEGNSPRAMPNFSNVQVDPVVFTNNLFKGTPAFDPRVQPMAPDTMNMEEMTIESQVPKLEDLKSKIQKFQALRKPASEPVQSTLEAPVKKQESKPTDDLLIPQGVSKMLQGLASIGGGKIDDNSDFYDKYRQYMLDKPARELEQKVKQRNFDRMSKMDDPNSQESVNMRKALSKLAPDLVSLYGKDWDKISANDKDSIFDIIKTREQIEGRKEASRLANDQRQDARDERRERDREKLDLKKSELTDKYVQKFQDKTQDTRNILGAVNDFESVLGKNLSDLNIDTRADKIKTGDKAIDLPGANIPGLGRMSFYDTDARKLRDSASKIFNVELKNRSGAAVTDQEMNRLRQEFSDGKFNTESELIDAIKRYKKATQRVLKQHEAGYKPEIVNTYKERNDANNVLTTESEEPVNIKQGSTKTDSKIEAYSKAHNLPYEQAESILRARGYNGGQ